jgi:hypothetical protein
MDSDNDDMTDDENDDPVAAHDEIGDLAFIVLTVLGQTEDRSKSPAPTNGNRKPHAIQTSLPQPILDFKTLGVSKTFLNIVQRQ